MRVVILYHPDSEQSGPAQDFKHEFQARYPRDKVELLSLETKEGWSLASLYDVVRYPAILILSGDGQLQKLWEDQPWPLLEQVAAYGSTQN